MPLTRAEISARWRVRGILCNKCNTNMGVMEVWYAKHASVIAAYLGREP